LTTMDKLDLLLEMYEAQQKEIKDKVTSNENNRQQQSGNMARCISKALRCWIRILPHKIPNESAPLIKTLNMFATAFTASPWRESDTYEKLHCVELCALLINWKKAVDGGKAGYWDDVKAKETFHRIESWYKKTGGIKD